MPTLHSLTQRAPRSSAFLIRNLRDGAMSSLGIKSTYHLSILLSSTMRAKTIQNAKPLKICCESGICSSDCPLFLFPVALERGFFEVEAALSLGILRPWTVTWHWRAELMMGTGEGDGLSRNIWTSFGACDEDSGSGAEVVRPNEWEERRAWLWYCLGRERGRVLPCCNIRPIPLVSSDSSSASSNSWSSAKKAIFLAFFSSIWSVLISECDYPSRPRNVDWKYDICNQNQNENENEWDVGRQTSSFSRPR